jgi:hypothetical protein
MYVNVKSLIGLLFASTLNEFPLIIVQLNPNEVLQRLMEAHPTLNQYMLYYEQVALLWFKVTLYPRPFITNDVSSNMLQVIHTDPSGSVFPDPVTTNDVLKIASKQGSVFSLGDTKVSAFMNVKKALEDAKAPTWVATHTVGGDVIPPALAYIDIPGEKLPSMTVIVCPQERFVSRWPGPLSTTLGYYLIEAKLGFKRANY